MQGRYASQADFVDHVPIGDLTRVHVPITVDEAFLLSLLQDRHASIMSNLREAIQLRNEDQMQPSPIERSPTKCSSWSQAQP